MTAGVVLLGQTEFEMLQKWLAPAGELAYPEEKRSSVWVTDMPSTSTISLNKGRFLSGLQCPKKLYLDVHQADIAEPLDPADLARLQQGTRVGRVAQGRYPGGVLVQAINFEEAVETTRRLLADPSVPAIFEGAFHHGGVRIRTDILLRAENDQWDLIEVKSSSQVKTEHVPDVAVQLHVLRGCGLNLRKASVLHLNNTCFYEGGEYDLEQLFTAACVDEETRPLLGDIPTRLEEMRETLSRDAPPEVEIGPHCSSPHRCPFWDHCHVGGPEFPVTELPRFGQRKKLKLRFEQMGIEDIRDIPVDMDGLPPVWERIRDVVRTGKPFIDPAIKDALKVIRYPIFFLDFETFNPGLPVYPNTRPFQIIPFQWSCHVLSEDGTLEHAEFLHDGADDPRPAFADSLLEVLGTEGSIVVYNQTFEAGRIRDLAEFLPEKADRLISFIDRFVDLLPIVRDHVYHPDFRGSFSIKKVLPALVPDLSYDALPISDGGLASVAFVEMLNPETSPERTAELKEGLLAYCRLDTLGMVKLFEVLS